MSPATVKGMTAVIRISDIVVLERARQAAEYGRRLIAQDATLRRLSLNWSIVLSVATTVAVYADLAGLPVPDAAIAAITAMLSVAVVALVFARHAARKDETDATWQEVAAVDRQQIAAMQAQAEDTQRQMIAEIARMRAVERDRHAEWEKGAQRARDRDTLLSHIFTELAHLRATECERERRLAAVSVRHLGAVEAMARDISVLRVAAQNRDTNVEQLAVGLAQIVKVAEHNIGVIELMAQDISIMEDRHERELAKAVTDAKNAGRAEGFVTGYEARDAEIREGVPRIAPGL